MERKNGLMFESTPFCRWPEIPATGLCGRGNPLMDPADKTTRLEAPVFSGLSPVSWGLGKSLRHGLRIAGFQLTGAACGPLFSPFPGLTPTGGPGGPEAGAVGDPPPQPTMRTDRRTTGSNRQTHRGMVLDSGWKHKREKNKIRVAE